jgi:hypothetical protein
MKQLKFFSILLLFLISMATSNAQAQFSINTYFGSLEECDTMTRSIYIVWWDNDFDFATEADVLLDSMISYRTTCLNDLLMADPPNPENGFYYNVYIHVPGNPNCVFNPLGWGNGQGTDPNGYPYLTLPDGVLDDWVNNSHETFHIFQYNSNSPGFSYAGDSQWYIEATANWFAGKQNPGADRAFIEAESLVRVPHVPLWLSFNNFPSYYPQNWQRYVHQYAMALLCYYLTDVVGISDQTIVEGFFNGTEELPQEYLFNQIGADDYRQHFIDWAAHMLNDFDFIAPNQASANLNEWLTYADLQDDHKFILTLDNEGTDGWYTPGEQEVTAAWSFNTYRLLNDGSETNSTYTFEYNGQPAGTYGDEADFRGKLLVRSSTSGSTFYDLDLATNIAGSLTLELAPSDTAVYFIIASMPDVFDDPNSDFQIFPYQMRIGPEPSTGIPENASNTERSIIGRYNLMGQEIDAEEAGVQIIIWSDGTVEKEVKAKQR